MSHYPLQALRHLLQPPASSRGAVVKVTGELVQVATAAGLVTARPSRTLTVGQAVSVRDGLATPVAVPSSSYAL